MALDIVSDYITAARRLLQDTSVTSPRYADTDMVDALNYAFLETRRVRPDVFIGTNFVIPSYSPSAMNAAVKLDAQLRMAFVYYVAGHMQLRDQEDVSDQRSTIFLNKFLAQLLTIQA